MFSFFKRHSLLWLLPLSLYLYHLAFENTAVFWYMYSFAILLLMSIAIVNYSVFDQLKTWQSLLYGVMFGTLLYALLALGYRFLDVFPLNIQRPVAALQTIFAPSSIWHYLLLMFIIVPGEEIFWRGFIQQQLKKYMKLPLAILSASLLFGVALSFSGFWPAIIAGILTGAVLGVLYEWKRSMPLLIITHLVILILLFLIFPLPA
ncbi:CPBP family intramembrane glutamic endopeptidase [Planococcus sp. ISL-109]|uniref:CPBP family intramembrane glutamic endopeptidase n=1 Tax=Planococcus sp. ISL-109 TaxID=2819166 RepID=UPI001BE6E496|nr:CPBP family intramembrane glutamic endopeptidase [Planococcus sp. ISL-109]MBT2581780.1 CPBP family intramembrane metalloprotease [Planococcus sp. ISL-109]